MQNVIELHTHAAEKSREEHERQAKYYNARRREATFQEGDLVLKRYKVLSSAAQGIVGKLAPPFAGPYTIIKVLDSNTYELTDRDGNEVGLIHAKQMKKCVSEEGDYNAQEPAPQQGEREKQEESEGVGAKNPLPATTRRYLRVPRFRRRPKM